LQNEILSNIVLLKSSHLIIVEANMDESMDVDQETIDDCEQAYNS
jgi:hypothetical protein